MSTCILIEMLKIVNAVISNKDDLFGPKDLKTENVSYSIYKISVFSVRAIWIKIARLLKRLFE